MRPSYILEIKPLENKESPAYKAGDRFSCLISVNYGSMRGEGRACKETDFQNIINHAAEMFREDPGLEAKYRKPTNSNVVYDVVPEANFTKEQFLKLLSDPKSPKKLSKERLIEVPGKYIHIDGLSPASYWVADCPVEECKALNSMDPERSFKPEEVCVHFQQLGEPGTASMFQFNPKAKALKCPGCEFETFSYLQLDLHVSWPCPGIKKKEKDATKKAARKPKPEKSIYTLKVEKVDHPGNTGAKYLVDFEIRDGIKEYGFGGVGVGIKDAKDLDKFVLQILTDANNLLKDHKELKSVYEELDFVIANESDIPDEKIRAAQVKAINDIFWKDTHPEESKAPEKKPEKPLLKIVKTTTSTATERRSQRVSRQPGQLNLDRFFPQNQSDLSEFYVMVRGGR